MKFKIEKGKYCPSFKLLNYSILFCKIEDIRNRLVFFVGALLVALVSCSKKDKIAVEDIEPVVDFDLKSVQASVLEPDRFVPAIVLSPSTQLYLQGRDNNMHSIFSLKNNDTIEILSQKIRNQSRSHTKIFFITTEKSEKLSYNYEEVVKNLQKQLYGVYVNELLTVDQSKDPFAN